jgi:hypothetical protein
MKTPVYVRELTEEERERLKTGLRSQDRFEIRRSQIVLASACMETGAPENQHPDEWKCRIIECGRGWKCADV